MQSNPDKTGTLTAAADKCQALGTRRALLQVSLIVIWDGSQATGWRLSDGNKGLCDATALGVYCDRHLSAVCPG